MSLRLWRSRVRRLWRRAVCSNSYFFFGEIADVPSTRFIQSLRERRRCHQGSCWILARQCHLCWSYRRSCLRTECSVNILTFLDLDLLFYSHLPRFSRNAMDNASKNASDMIGSLQMKYNRGRQAAITNELVDIITGMSLCSQFVFFYSHKPPLRCQCSVSLFYDGKHLIDLLFMPNHY